MKKPAPQPATDPSLTSEQQALAAKLTNLQRGVVIGVVAGKSQRQAYRDAGGSAKTDEAADVIVSKMLGDAKVKAFHFAMLGTVAKAAQVTLQTLLDELEEARQAAVGGEGDKAQAAAMVAATMGKAKLLGLEAPSKLDHTSSDGSMSPTRIILEAAPVKPT